MADGGGVLTVALVAELGGQDGKAIQKLDVSNRRLERVENLSECNQLLRLDLSHNSLERIKGVARCRSLTWLDLSHNKLGSLSGVQRLVNLSVLRASNNTITTSPDLSPLSKLKALILSNNNLSVLPGLSSLLQLNTLVLSHNQFEVLDVSKLKNLTKLSVSCNLLREVPDTQYNLELGELRLNGNGIKSVPETLKLNTKLKIVDFGNNKLKKISMLKTIGCIGKLANVNLKGNPLCDDPNYAQQVLELLSSVAVVDGTKRRLEPHSATAPIARSDTSDIKSPVRLTERKRHLLTKEPEGEKAPIGNKRESEQQSHGGPESKKLKLKSRKSTDKPESKILKAARDEKYTDEGLTLPSAHHVRPGSLIANSEASEQVPGNPVVGKSFQKKIPRGRSGVVAVQEVRKRRKGKKSNPLSFDSDHYLVGSGHTSTWT